MIEPFTGMTIDLIALCLGIFAAAWLGRSAYLRAEKGKRLQSVLAVVSLSLAVVPLLFIVLLVTAWRLVAR